MLQDIKTYLTYVPNTGTFIWIKSPCDSVLMGDQAGTISTGGYIQIQWKGKLYLAHRLAWWFIHGYFPKCIDHINRDRKDNRICNLRSVTRSQNQQNRFSKNYTWDTSCNKWKVRITCNKVTHTIGLFDTEEQAQLAAKQAKKQFHPLYTEKGG